MIAFKYYEFMDNHPQIYIICLLIGIIGFLAAYKIGKE